jgi:hypothetical protein
VLFDEVEGEAVERNRERRGRLLSTEHDESFRDTSERYFLP